MTETIQQALDRYVAAVERIDRAALAACYEPDARVSDAMMGWRRIGDEWTGQAIDDWFAVLREPCTCAFEHVHVIEDGDLAAVDADIRYAGPVEVDGRRMDADELTRMTQVWRRRDGVWRIAVEHSSKPVDEHGRAVERDGA